MKLKKLFYALLACAFMLTATPAFAATSTEGEVIEVTKVMALGDAIEVNVGQTRDMGVYVLPENATDQSIQYETKDSDLVEVSADGKVTGISAGVATVTARATNGVHKDIAIMVCAVTVDVTGVQTDSESYEVAIDESKSLNANILPANATNKTLQYTTSDNEIVSVSKSGVITGHKPGNATIKITTNKYNVNKTVDVTVLDAHGSSGGGEATSPPSPDDSSASIDFDVTIEPPILDVTVPIEGFAITIRSDRYLAITHSVVLLNNSAYPVRVTAVSACAAEGTEAKVVPYDKYDQEGWDNLSESETNSQIALGMYVQDMVSDLKSVTDWQWFTGDGIADNLELGVIKSAFNTSEKRMELGLDLQSGKNWGDTTALKYKFQFAFEAE